MSFINVSDKSDSGLIQVCQVQDRLDINEIFSIVFLLYEDIEVALHQLYLEALKSNLISPAQESLLDSSLFREGNTFPHQEGPLVVYYKLQPKSWKRKLEEALLIIQNYECLRKVFGMKRDDDYTKSFFVHKYDFSVEVDTVRKFLYMILEHLSSFDCKLVLKHINDDLVNSGKDLPLILKDSDIPAEYHMLFYLARGHLQIKSETTNMNFSILTSSLSRRGFSSLANRVKDFENFINKQGASGPERVLSPSKQYLSSSNMLKASASTCGDKFELDPTYPGEILIINQVRFNEKENRTGSDKDTEKLQETFKLLNFECKTVSNRTAHQMLEDIKTGIREFCSNFFKGTERCFVLAVLSHGDKYGVYGVDGEIIPWDAILDMMRSEQLSGMPRLIICQSCKGTTQVATVNGKAMLISTDDGGICLDDLLVYSSCVSGFTSYRSPTLGSFFINALCEGILLHGASEDFLGLTHHVNHKMSAYKIAMKGNSVKMTSEVSGTLTKRLYLSVPPDRQIVANFLVSKWKKEYSDLNEEIVQRNSNEKIFNETTKKLSLLSCTSFKENNSENVENSCSDLDKTMQLIKEAKLSAKNY